jgi:D-xylose reductase
VQKDLVSFCQRFGVAVTGYANLGAMNWGFKRKILEEPIITSLAQKHGKTPAQIALNWGLHRGYSVIPKTSRVDRLEENIQIFDFSLNEEEYESISSLNCGVRYYSTEKQSVEEYNKINIYA